MRQIEAIGAMYASGNRNACKLYVATPVKCNNILNIKIMQKASSHPFFLDFVPSLEDSLS